MAATCRAAKPQFEAYLKLAPTGQYAETAKSIARARSSKSPALNDIVGNLAAIRARDRRGGRGRRARPRRRPPARGLQDVRRRPRPRRLRGRPARLRREQGPGSPAENRRNSRIRDQVAPHRPPPVEQGEEGRPGLCRHPLDRFRRPAAPRGRGARPTRGRRPTCYIQVDLAGESTKFGAPEADVPEHRARGARVPRGAAERPDAAAAVVRRRRTGAPLLPAPPRAARTGWSRTASTQSRLARAVDGHEPRLRSGDPGRGHARPRRHRDFRQTDCEDLMFERTTPPPRTDDPGRAAAARAASCGSRRWTCASSASSTAMRGYDRTEVVAFLTEAADDYEHAMREIDRLRSDLMRMEALLGEHREREDNLRDTLMTAQRLSDEIKESGPDRGEADHPRSAGARRHAAAEGAGPARGARSRHQRAASCGAATRKVRVEATIQALYRALEFMRDQDQRAHRRQAAAPPAAPGRSAPRGPRSSRAAADP